MPIEAEAAIQKVWICEPFKGPIFGGALFSRLKYIATMTSLLHGIQLDHYQRP